MSNNTPTNRESHVISLPADLFNDGDEWRERMLNQAIYEARDGEHTPFKDWCVPALWEAEFVSNDYAYSDVEIKVTRITTT